MQLGRYRIVREIARSNDIVYEAHDPKMNRRLAIKELALTAGLDGAARRERIERFYREARAAGALSHPGILTIHEVGEDNGRYFIAMEYLEGQTLRERLNTVGMLPVAEAVRIAGALCDALEYAHARGVIHRDIKPDNIHLLPDNRVKLTDFGIARIQHEAALTRDGRIFGTPSYMAPEQIRGGIIDGRADLFSLGILLYEMITGRKPFTGDSIATITYRLMNEPMPPALGVAPALNDVIQRASAKDPTHRFPNATALRDALRGALSAPAGPPTSFIPPQPLALPAQATVQYGTHTQFGVAPVQPVAPPPTLPPPTDPAVAERRRRWGTLAAAVLIGGGALGAVGVALSRALRTANLSMSADAVRDQFNRAIQRYKAQDYARAAVLFETVRSSADASATDRRKAAEYEGYCYRKLGQDAQGKDDFAQAAKWYRQALEVNPDDPQARTEYDAAVRIAESRGEPLPSPSPEADHTTQFPRPRRSDTPNVGTNDFVRQNEEAARSAQGYLSSGDQAQQRGNMAQAREMWQKAVEAGPGTQAAIDAQQRLTQAGGTVFGG